MSVWRLCQPGQFTSSSMWQHIYSDWHGILRPLLTGGGSGNLEEPLIPNLLYGWHSSTVLYDTTPCPVFNCQLETVLHLWSTRRGYLAGVFSTQAYLAVPTSSMSSSGVLGLWMYGKLDYI